MLFAPVLLNILIIHIVIAIRWMLIKTLSAVINHHGQYKIIAVVGFSELHHIVPNVTSRSIWVK